MLDSSFLRISCFIRFNFFPSFCLYNFRGRGLHAEFIGSRGIRFERSRCYIPRVVESHLPYEVVFRTGMMTALIDLDLDKLNSFSGKDF